MNEKYKRFIQLLLLPCNVHSKPEIMREWYED